METLNKKKLTIIDGSSKLFSASSNNSRDEEKTDDFSNYRESLDYYIESTLDNTNADCYIIFGDKSTSFRKRLYPSFKADRNKRPSMKFLPDLLFYAKERWNWNIHKDLEADDLCLITHNLLKDKYDITIAAIDSDILQYPANFYNYGIFRKKEYRIEDAFITINKEQAEKNLWKQVLTKGHNNKIDYLEGCGEKTASMYLSKWNINQYAFAVLKAYIKGIEKDSKYNIKRSVNGYGLLKGINKFQRSFNQSYLLRNLDELKLVGITYEIPEIITYT